MKFFGLRWDYRFFGLQGIPWNLLDFYAISNNNNNNNNKNARGGSKLTSKNQPKSCTNTFKHLLFCLTSLAKTLLHSSQNHPNMNQNYVKKPFNSSPGGTAIEVQRTPGQAWKRLGLSWAIQNVFGGVLGRLGSFLEGFGGVLDRLSCCPRRSQDR